jgi:hypothetical protein
MTLPVLDVELNGMTLGLIFLAALWVLAAPLVSAARQWWRDRKKFK